MQKLDLNPLVLAMYDCPKCKGFGPFALKTQNFSKQVYPYS